MVSALNSRPSDPCSSPGRVVLLGKTLNSYSAPSLLPGVQMGTSKFNAGSSLAMD